MLDSRRVHLTRYREGDLKVWRGRYRDGDGIIRTVSLCANKSASRAMLADLTGKASARGAACEPIRRSPGSCWSITWQTTNGTWQGRGTRLDTSQSKQPGSVRSSRAAGFDARRPLSIASSRAISPIKRFEGLVFHVQPLLDGREGFHRWLVKDRRVADDVLAHLWCIDARLT